MWHLRRPTIVLDARYVSHRRSGIGRHVLAIAKRLPQLRPDWDFRFWTHPRAPAELFVDAKNAHYVSVAAHPNGPRSLIFPRSLGGLRDVSLFHSPHNILGDRMPCPCVTTVHDLMWLDEPAYCEPNRWLRPIREKFFGRGIRQALTQSRVVLTVSRASARAIRTFAPHLAERIFVSANAADEHFTPSTESAKELLGFDAPYYLVVGQNQPSKGHALALRAFAAARSADVRLVFLQRVRPGAELCALAEKLKVANRVHFVPEIKEVEYRTLLRSAKALLQPSLAEGFGMPALEALSCGVPVIASDIPALKEVLGGMGLHSRAGDWRSLAYRLEELNDEPAKAEELRLRGPLRARQFSWDDCAGQVVRAYEVALASAPD